MTKSLVFWLAMMFIMMWVSHAMTPIEFANEVWAKPALSKELRNACQDATDPVHCFWVWLSISKAESQMWNGWIGHWYFGMMWAKDKSATRRVKSYNKYWYKAQDGKYFYGDKWVMPVSRYCTSEHSSNSSVWCPNGKANYNSIRYEYKTRVMTQPLFVPPLDTGIQIPDDWFNPNCRMVWEVREWEYIQVDFIQKLRQKIFPPTNSKIFICPK